MESGLDVVFIDFIQNLTKKGAGGKYEMAADIALDLQALAKELRCHIVALSQIPNDEGKQDSGLLVYKGAGEIAAAADVGMLIKRAKNPDNMLELQIRKNRHGMLTKFYMEFQNNWTRLEETT
jgi:replicative DNA helicase